MFENIFFVIEMLGTVAFTVSGVLVARERKMDLFGALVLGGVTAVGGGAIRDLLLGYVPPQMFLKPVYVTTSAVVSLLVFLYFLLQEDRKHPIRSEFYGKIFNMSDSFGLSVFAVSGSETAIRCGYGDKMFLTIFVGILTAVGGGVLRDILAGQMPLIMRKRVYAVAAAAGALVFYCLCVIMRVDKTASTVISIFSTVLIRSLAIHYRWNLPHFPE